MDDDEFEQDTFRVRFTERAVHEGHSTLDFVLSSSQDDYELTARIIHCPEWPAAMAMANKSGGATTAAANSNGNACGGGNAAHASSNHSSSLTAGGEGVLSKSLVSKVFDVLKLVQDWHLEYQRGPLVVVDK